MKAGAQKEKPNKAEKQNVEAEAFEFRVSDECGSEISQHIEGLLGGAWTKRKLVELKNAGSAFYEPCK